MTPDPRVVIVGGNRTALAVARAIRLGLPGARIEVAAPTRRPLPSFSAAVDRSHRISPADDPPAWRRAMRRLGEGIGGDGSRPFLFPVNDADLLAAVHAWGDLKPYFRSAFETDLDRLEVCLDKLRTAELARQLDVPVPTTARTAEEYARRKGAFPAVVKPSVKGAAEALRAGVPRIAVCRDAEELERATREVGRGATPLIQEWVPGGDDELYTVGFASYRGRLAGTFTGRKLRQFPPGAGEASYAESIAFPQGLRLARRLIEKACFSGVGQVEFKKRGDDFMLIEINPRPWSWIGLATRCGVNLPSLFLERLTGGTPIPTTQEHGRCWIMGIRDLEHHGWPRGMPGMLGWMRDLMTADAHAFLSWTDPVPGVVGNLQELRRLRRRS